MKISELTPLAQLLSSAQIPVVAEGENRSISIGQILDALQKAVVPFAHIDYTNPVNISYGIGSTLLQTTIVWDRFSKQFCAAIYNVDALTGAKRVVLYSEWNTRGRYYIDDKVRNDCLFIDTEGRLYRHNGSDLISAGLTDEQAALLKKLTPQKLESESDLAALEAAGEIVPGQIYYIAENE